MRNGSLAQQMESASPRTDWWDTELDGPREAAAFSLLSALRSLQRSRINSGLLYEATYEQRNMFASDAGSGAAFPALGFGPWSARGEINLLTYNAMQIGFDTFVSKLAQADAQVKFLTDDADWETRKKAEQLEKLVAGEFYRLHFYEIKQEISLDMLLFGRGFIKFYVDHDTKSPCAERVHPLDIFFDELEARDNPPQTMSQVRVVSKASLIAQYPEFSQEIMFAQLSGDSNVYSSRALNPAQMVEVLESWHLPSYPGADDGHWGFFIQTATLEFEPYTRDDFPFATMTWTNRRRGPYPISAAEQIIFLQRNLNRLVQREHECTYMLSAPYILSSETQALNTTQFTTDVGNFITYMADGSQPPSIVVNKVVPDDIRMAREQLKRDIAEVLGEVGLESTGEKPQGLDSAPALESYTEHTSVRQMSRLKENERCVLRAADQLLHTIREIKDRYGDYKAFGQGRSRVEQVKFTDADLPPDAYMAQMAPANMLPATPAGRMNKIVQLAGTGIFSPKQMIRAFQSPDIDAIVSDVTATEEDIEWTIWEMSKIHGRYLPPDEHQDLTGGIEAVNNAYLESRRRNAPPEVLERLDRWVAEAVVMQEQMAQAQMAKQMALQQSMQQAAPMSQPPGAPPVMDPAAMGGTPSPQGA